MKIVFPSEIPKEIVNTPIDDLPKLYKTCLEMQELCKKENGVGLSAVQVGIPWKLFVIRITDKKYRYFIDCEYEPIGTTKIQSVESCLSLRDLKKKLFFFQVERFERIKVKGFELLTEEELKIVPFEQDFDDFSSVLYQHEIDHHHGILINRGKRKNFYR